jgi:pyruvate dehydrogenase E1 component beta subunit
MDKNIRLLTYAEAIREAIFQEMQRDDSVLVMGQGVDDPKGTAGTTLDLHKNFGNERSFDVPLAEDGMLGVAIGAALAGLRPINVHIRLDFMLLCMNQLINMAAKNHYMSGGDSTVPLVLKGAIGRSWGQGSQHSQAFQSFFMHVPGLKVVAPTFASDAKGAMVAAIRDENPVVYIEHRMLFGMKEHTPKELYSSEIGKARTVINGDDITIVGISHMVIESYRACKLLQLKSINAELIDPIWLSPLDIDTIIESVGRTNYLLVVDNGWQECGVAAEICMKVVEFFQGKQNIKVGRLGFANTPCPTTPVLEDHFYPNAASIASRVFEMIRPNEKLWKPKHEQADEVANFKGPF